MKDKKYRLRDVPRGQRLRHFFHYYKLHVFFGAALLILLGQVLYAFLTPQPEVRVMWLSDQYTANCEYALRDTLKSLDWDLNGNGRVDTQLTYICFDHSYHDLSYDTKSELTVLAAGQTYSFYLVNDYAKSWMEENDILAHWSDIGIEQDGFAAVPVSQLSVFSGQYEQPLQSLWLCIPSPPADPADQAEYQRQAEALRRLLLP